MKHFLLLYDIYKDKEGQKASVFAEYLKKYEVLSDLDSIDDELLDRYKVSDMKDSVNEIDDDRVYDKYSLIIVFGGDGSFLRAAKLAYYLNTPILGVNLGRLGFMLTQDFDECLHNIESIAALKLIYEDRSV